MNKENEERICPAENIKYIGKCRVFSCAANLSFLTEGKKFGCVFSSGKISLKKLGNILEIDPKKVKSEYTKGIKSIESLAIVLNKLQETNQKDIENRSHYCDLCGVKTLSQLNCANVVNCNSRVKVMKKGIKKYPFSEAGIGLTKKDFWKIAVFQKNEVFPKIISNTLFKAVIQTTKNLNTN